MLIGVISPSEAMVNGVPILLVVLGLVEWSKRLGLRGNWLLVEAMVLGFVFGFGFQLSQAIPATFVGWFGAVLYGLLCGLVASGLNDWAVGLAVKASGTVSHG